MHVKSEFCWQFFLCPPFVYRLQLCCSSNVLQCIGKRESHTECKSGCRYLWHIQAYRVEMENACKNWWIFLTKKWILLHGVHFGEKSKYQILQSGNRDFDPLNGLKSKNKKNFTNPTFKVGLVKFFLFFDLSPFKGWKSRFVEKRLFLALLAK
jgi:hypothetical protein